MIGQHTPAALAFRRPWPGTRRGLKLWLIGIIIALKGISYVFVSSPASTDSALRLLIDGSGILPAVPIQAWGILITALAGFAMFTSYCHFGRDQYGYKMLTAFSLAWAAAYAAAPFFLDGPWYALQGTLTWLTVAGVLLLCAGDVEVRLPASREEA